MPNIANGNSVISGSLAVCSLSRATRCRAATKRDWLSRSCWSCRLARSCWLRSLLRSSGIDAMACGVTTYSATWTRRARSRIIIAGERRTSKALCKASSLSTAKGKSQFHAASFSRNPDASLAEVTKRILPEGASSFSKRIRRTFKRSSRRARASAWSSIQRST